MKKLALLLALTLTFALLLPSCIKDGVNVLDAPPIKTGIIDVKLSTSDDNVTFTETVKNAPTIGNNVFWEPGYIGYQFVKIENAGTLNLKYKLEVVPQESNNLSEVIYLYAKVVDDSFRFNDPNDLEQLDRIGLLSEVNSAANGTLMCGESTVICVALKMSESAGIEYQNVTNGYTVTLYASQLTAEDDSFDNNYN